LELSRKLQYVSMGAKGVCCSAIKALINSIA